MKIGFFKRNEKEPCSWQSDIRARFPDWQTDEALERWPTERQKLVINQIVEGEIIAVASFGAWLDIGVSFPALLHMTSRDNLGDSPRRCDLVYTIGEMVIVRIQSFGNRGEIYISRRSANGTIDW